VSSRSWRFVDRQWKMALDDQPIMDSSVFGETGVRIRSR
jgi:hypothetical protein